MVSRSYQDCYLEPVPTANLSGNFLNLDLNGLCFVELVVRRFRWRSVPDVLIDCHHHFLDQLTSLESDDS